MKSKPLPTLQGPYRQQNMQPIPELQDENNVNENIPEAPQQPENQNPGHEKTYTSSFHDNNETRNTADKTITPSETSSNSISNSTVSSPKNQRPFALHSTSSSKSSSLGF